MARKKNSIDTEVLKKIYRTVSRIRHFEEQGIKLYRQGLIKGYFHPYLGQEGIAAGVCAGLQSGDTPGTGPDPCVNCIKSLAVIVTGCKGTSEFGSPVPPPPPATPLFRYDVTVPLGATADVHIPMMGLLTSAHVSEAGNALWTNGQMHRPDVSGVLAAAANAASGTVVVTVGSGSYSFDVHQ